MTVNNSLIIVMDQLMKYVVNPKISPGVEGSIGDLVKKDYKKFLSNCKEWSEKHK